MRSAALPVIVFVLFAVFSLDGLGDVGLLGPDEPRYASIGREMALSGDWITPRLWGDPWFEKPPLVYWLAAAGHATGLGDDLAPRAPVALLSVLFLAFQFVLIRRLFDASTAWVSTLLLGTTAGWTAYSHVGVTDLPLAVTFAAALLLCMLWMQSGSLRALYAAAACFGLAVLAKGLVPVVLILPFLWLARRQWRALLMPSLLALLIASPWFLAMLFLHGRPFFDEFFVRHHLARFTSGGLLHLQPVWFYIPVLIGGLFPWPVMLSVLGPFCWRDERVRIPAATLAFGLLFFSLSSNKLPGYILPLVPQLALLVAVGTVRAAAVRRQVALSMVLVGLCPVVVSILPESLLFGLRRAELGTVRWEPFAAVLPLAALAWWLDRRGQRMASVGLAGMLALAGLWYVKHSAEPVLDQLVSARSLWGRVERHSAETCVESLHRNWRYGLNYYSRTPLPDCDAQPRKYAVTQEGRGMPSVTLFSGSR